MRRTKLRAAGSCANASRRHLVRISGITVSGRAFPWKLYGAELIGTAVLVAVGLSIVILDFGQGSPVSALLPNASARRLVTGFLFGTTGGLIAISPLGKESGAHINPAVTFGFWLIGRMRLSHSLGYVVSQLAGALLGAVPLLAWGRMGMSIAYGATVPNPAYGIAWALAGEAAATFALIFLLFLFLRDRRLRAFTPAIFAPLYAIMVWIEAPVSGTSTNPARSLGPSAISGVWEGWWIYWLGPLIGTLLAVLAYRCVVSPRHGIEVAKVYHFAHDRYGIFRATTQ